jgi:hypothetical protein
MLELLFCSLLTIVPDYLYRRYVQGKRDHARETGHCCAILFPKIGSELRVMS